MNVSQMFNTCFTVWHSLAVFDCIRWFLLMVACIQQHNITERFLDIPSLMWCVFIWFGIKHVLIWMVYELASRIISLLEIIELFGPGVPFRSQFGAWSVATAWRPSCLSRLSAWNPEHFPWKLGKINWTMMKGEQELDMAPNLSW